MVTRSGDAVPRPGAAVSAAGRGRPAEAVGRARSRRAAACVSATVASLDSVASSDTVFAPVRSQTAFEETVERLGTAIKVGLLPPGTRLPSERELCMKLGIARSTLRQALVALGQSGHLHAIRGRGGGTFVADPQPPARPPSPQLLSRWRQVCDERMAVEVGVAVLAAERADRETLFALDDLVVALDGMLEDFPSYRQADVRWHVGLAEATRSPALVASMTEIQGAMTELISYIAHPPEVLDSSNAQHRRVLSAVRARDEAHAAQEMTEHLRATEHVLAGLLPSGSPSGRRPPRHRRGGPSPGRA